MNRKQFFRDHPMIRCPEKTSSKLTGEKLMQKLDFNKAAAIQLYWNHTSACVLRCKFTAYPRLKNDFSTLQKCRILFIPENISLIFKNYIKYLLIKYFRKPYFSTSSQKRKDAPSFYLFTMKPFALLPNQFLSK